MKKLLLFLFLFISFSQIDYAQISVGAIGNLNNSNISGDAPSKVKYTGRTALGGGLIVEYKITDEVYISLQPMLLPKGTTISYDLPSYEEERDSAVAKLTYYTIPLMVKVFANKTVFVTSGFDIGFLQSANSELSNIDKEKDISKNFKSTDISFNFGVGLTFKIRFLNLFIEGRYSQGLFNTSNFPKENEYNIPTEFKNTGIQVLFGAMYDF